MSRWRDDEGYDPFSAFVIVEMDFCPGQDTLVSMRPAPRSPAYQAKIDAALAKIEASLDRQEEIRNAKA